MLVLYNFTGMKEAQSKLNLCWRYTSHHQPDTTIHSNLSENTFVLHQEQIAADKDA